jgi:hypothetical protein
MSRLLRRSKALLGTAMIAGWLASGCGTSNDFVATNTAAAVVPPVPSPPVAVPDAFNALGNATVNQTAANGVLANDTVAGGQISAFDATGSQGGAVVLNADGSFSYTPVFGFVGAETFTYTLSNGDGDSTATVTLTSTAEGWFVNNTVAPGGNGSQADPFDTLGQAIGTANAGDTIFVSRGDGTSTGIAGAIDLPAGVDLIGEGAGLVLAQTVVSPGLAPMLTGPITFGGTNTLSGFTIDGPAADRIIINGVGDVTVSNNTIGNPLVNHIDCDDVTGTVTISGNTLENPANLGGDFINVVNASTNGNLVISDNVFTNTINNLFDDCIEIDLFGTSVMDITISGNTANGAVADQLRFGFAVLAYDDSQATVLMDSNTLTNLDDYALSLVCFNTTSNIDGTISGNTVSNISASGILVPVNGSVTVSGNMVDSAVDGISILGFGSSAATIVVENNSVTNSVNNAFLFLGEQSARIAIRDNVLGNSGSFSVNIIENFASNLCLDITGNTVDDDMYIDTTAAGATIDLENGAAGLETVNTFSSGVPIINATMAGTVTNRAASFCAIP